MKVLVFSLLISLCLAYKNSRIVGGQDATAGEYNFLAAVYKTTPNGSFFCGGSLLYKRWILTAGQCVDGATSFTIYLGTNNVKNPDESALKLTSEEYILHPNYNSTTLESDIGLIKLQSDVTFTENISSISIPVLNLTPGQDELQAFGWGQTSDGNSELADKLQSVKLKIISNDECKVTYGNQITDSMICLNGNNNGGICQGDIGSPVVWTTLSNLYVHYGIASFVSGNGCESNDPSGFTKTLKYRNWIISTTF